MLGRIWSGLGRNRLERTVRLLLLLIVFCLPFGAVILLAEGSEGSSPFTVPRLYLIEPVIVLTAGLWAILRPSVGTALRPYKPVLGVLGLAAVSVIWAPDPELAAVTFGHLVAAFLLLYMLAAELRDEGFFRATVWVFVGSVGLQAGWAVVQYLVGHDLGGQRIGESLARPDQVGIAKVTVDGEPHIRAYGTLPHPNLLAAYLAAAIFALGTITFWPAGHSRRRAALFGGGLALLATALVLTFSRAALALVIVNGLLLVGFSYRKWRRLPVAAAIGAVAFLIALLLAWEPLSGRATFESQQETGLTNRKVGYEVAAEALQNRPLGVGAGNFVVAIDELREGLPEYQHQPVHNALLLAAAEAGVLAGVLLAWFVIRLGWLFHHVRVRDRRRNTANFAIFVLAGTAIGLGMVDHFFWSLPQGLWLVCLVAAATISRVPADRWIGSKPAAT